MKRMMLISVVIMLGLSLSLIAQAGPVLNENNDEYFWSTQEGDFATKFWKEKFFGGKPGQPGNVLMAIGQGFVLQNLVLKEVFNCFGCNNPEYIGTEPINCSYICLTDYEGGMLTLNSSGPWLRKGSLKSTNVSAENASFHDVDGTLLGFWLYMSGDFNNSDYSFQGTAQFIASPNNYEVKPDDDGAGFHRGFNFDATIEIFE